MPAHAARVQVPDAMAAGSDVSPRADSPAQALATATATAAAAAPDAEPHAAVASKSMDVPIQGGLTAHQEQAVSARLVSAHTDPAVAAPTAVWTAAMGRSAVARAESWLGMPYSWAGGSATGPTTGQCDPGTGGDLDCYVVGFDCSGLAMYAWGAYTSLPHLAAAQRDAGQFHPSVKQLLPGDLVFFSGYLPGGTGHVAIYIGGGLVIEAPQSGSVVHRAKLADLISEDGAYRGAVRPLTGQTPTLAKTSLAVPLAGGKLTLHGTHLASVDAVTIGGVVVRTFVKHTDSTIVVRAPAHARGPVAVTVSTSWRATSRSVTLTYAKPRRAPVTAPTTPVITPPASTTTPPVSTPPVSTPPVSKPPASTTKPAPPAPTSPAPSGPATPTSGPITAASSATQPKASTPTG